MKTAKLNKDYFNQVSGSLIQVLEFRGAGLYRVKFSDGSTGIIGKSSFNLIK